MKKFCILLCLVLSFTLIFGGSSICFAESEGTSFPFFTPEKNCVGLKKIRLDGNCDIEETAFDGCEEVYVFAPKGGCTEAFCNDPAQRKLIFVESN